MSSFISWKSRGISKITSQRIIQICGFIWDKTQGNLNQKTLSSLSDYYIKKYPSESSLKKCFNYTRAFLKYLYKSRMDSRILTLLIYVETPNNRKEHKLMTERIITDDDIDAVSTRIRDEVKIRLIDAQKGLHHKTLVLFAAYSGQRPSTIGRLTVGQFRQALSLEYPVLKVEAHQDKIRMAHYVPIHPSLIKDLNELINERADEEKMFNTLVMERWLKERNIPLSKANNCSKFVLSDCRKFFEQKSDEIGFDDANKAFIMTHGVSGVQWSNYKAFLPENVYSRYMEYWGKSEI